MPYVPGSEVDVFISYSHADNQDAWVTNFEQPLKGRLHVLLGKEAEVWRDTRKLSGEHDFTEEIKLRLTRTAVMVVVVSPGYLGSTFCRLERQHFSTHATGGLKVGTRLKIVKAIKLPDDNRLHESITAGLGFKFFNEKGEHGPIEYFPGDRDFVLEIDHLARGVTNILRDLYNATTPVYVAEPPPAHVDPVWNRLRSELGSLGFGVLPNFRLEEGFAREILLQAIKPAHCEHPPSRPDVFGIRGETDSARSGTRKAGLRLAGA